MQLFSATPVALVQSLISNRSLIYQMSKREVIGRYKGSMLGMLWSFFNPVMLLIVYTFVFSVIFGSRWGEGVSKIEFAAILFAGLIVYGVFSESMNRAPTLILNNVNYVKKVVFPLEILPWVGIGASLFHAGINLLVLLVFYLVVHGSLSWTVILLPLILFPFSLFVMGFSWLLASLGTFVRDIRQIIGVVVTAMMFLSPIFYPASAFPEAYKPFFYLNPMTFIIEQSRAVLLWGNLPDWHGLLIYSLVSMLVAWGGFAWFQKTRRGFADVL